MKLMRNRVRYVPYLGLMLFFILNSGILGAAWLSSCGRELDPGRRGPFEVVRTEYSYGDRWCHIADQGQALKCPCFLPGEEDLACSLPTDELAPNPVEFTAAVYYPQALSEAKHKKFPLIIFLHGGHDTCFVDHQAGSGAKRHDHVMSTSRQWLCDSRELPASITGGSRAKAIPSYEGYAYIGERLASHGYVVVSISANGINAVDIKALSTKRPAWARANFRAQLIREHLTLWTRFANEESVPPFGPLFFKKVDLDHVGLMGHSLGGEGVVRYYNNKEAHDHDSCTTTTCEPSDAEIKIKAIFTLAPTNTPTETIHQVPFATMLSYCDGDIAGQEFRGLYYFNNVWYGQDQKSYNPATDTAPRHLFLVMGANHNFYNTIWTPGLFPAGAFDDWTRGRPLIQDADLDPHCGARAGNQRLTAVQQRGAALTYVVGFFRYYLGGDTAFYSMLTGDTSVPASAMTKNIFVSYHAPYAQRLDVNRLLVDDHLETVNSVGGKITYNEGIKTYCLCGREETVLCSQGMPVPEMCQQVISVHRPEFVRAGSANQGLRQLLIAWEAPLSEPAWYRNEWPEWPDQHPIHSSYDISRFKRLQFRAAVALHVDHAGLPVNQRNESQDFTIVLTSQNGHTAKVRVSDQSRALFFPPGRIENLEDAYYPVPKVLLNMVSIPLTAFHGVDLKHMKSIEFRFDQRPSGAIVVSQIAFSK